jgi:hypothetical protein
VCKDADNHDDCRDQGGNPITRWQHRRYILY